MVAIGERDAAVTETEKRAGAALRALTEVERLSLSEAVGPLTHHQPPVRRRNDCAGPYAALCALIASVSDWRLERHDGVSSSTSRVSAAQTPPPEEPGQLARLPNPPGPRLDVSDRPVHVRHLELVGGEAGKATRVVGARRQLGPHPSLQLALEVHM